MTVSLLLSRWFRFAFAGVSSDHHEEDDRVGAASECPDLR